MFEFLTLLSCIMLYATVIPILPYSGWWIRGFDFPRFQLAILALTNLVLAFAFLDLSFPPAWFCLVVNAGCLVYQTWWIVPYTRLFPIEVHNAKTARPEHTLRIMTANVLMTNTESRRLLALIERYQPDIIVTLETNAWWEEQLQPLLDEYPYTMKCPLENLYGMHVYSQLELRRGIIKFLVEEQVPSMHVSVVMRSGDEINAHFLHPAPPSPTENEESTERDVELVIVAESIAAINEPTIVTGDLNDVAWSRTTRLFRKISGLLDPRIGRGMFNTFHADHWFLRWPLDHLFHSDHFTVKKIQRLPPFGSDHFPLLAELVLTPEEQNKQSGLEQTSENPEWIEEDKREKNVSKRDVPKL